MFESGVQGYVQTLTERQALKDADLHRSGPFGPRFTTDRDERKGAFFVVVVVVVVFVVGLWRFCLRRGHGSRISFLTF